MQKILGIIFGTSWKTSLLGLLAGVALAAAGILEGKTEPGWYLLALALAALGRWAKDASATGGTVPVTDEAARRIAGR